MVDLPRRLFESINSRLTQFSYGNVSKKETTTYSIMPPVSTITSQKIQEPSEAFTVLNNDHHASGDYVASTLDHFDRTTSNMNADPDGPLKRNVNIVQPVQRVDLGLNIKQPKSENSLASKLLNNIDDRYHNNSANKQDIINRNNMTASVVIPQTILDPKFSKALDYKLRRLKDKEILQTNLRRPSRFRPTNRFVTGSNPNVSVGDANKHLKKMSTSNPDIDTIDRKNVSDLASVQEKKTDDTSKISTGTYDKSPISPDRKIKSKKSPNPKDVTDKPRFVTTVKKGQFLLPPPEVASLLGLQTLYPSEERPKVVYCYASKPKVVSSGGKSVKLDEQKTRVQDAGAKQKLVSLFGGVRSLVTGIIGLKSNLNQRDVNPGSQASLPYTNLMHDKRVVRGSNFAQHAVGAGDGESAAARAAETRRRALARRAARRPGTPPPAPGRRHRPIQTEHYLEELFDKGVEMEVGVQTDLFLDRPATPIYVPAKTGRDAWTQIYPGDLFDFDLEVQPILETLVGKTTEQALLECLEEEELAALREQQRRFAELRAADEAERQRLHDQDKRIRMEKEKRITAAASAAALQREARDRVAAAALVQGYIADLLPQVLTGLEQQGYLFSRIRRSVDEEFLPWLLNEVSLEIEEIITSRDVITEIVRDVVEARGELYAAEGARSEAPSPPSTVSMTAEQEGEEMYGVE